MRSLVVLFALVAVAVAAPYGGQLVVASPYQQVPKYVAPSAVSHQSRIDYNGPIVPAEQVFATSPFTAGLAPVPAFYAGNPVYSGLQPQNYYGGQVLAPFRAPDAVFAAY